MGKPQWEMIDIFDSDKDGTIDHEDFCRAVLPDVNETPHWF